MKKLTAIALVLSGCTQQTPETQHLVQSLKTYHIVCLGGIKYYESDSALAPMVTRNGKYFQP